MKALQGATPNFYNSATAVISAATQTIGTGLSDLTIAGTYTVLIDHTYDIKITTAAGTDKFEWRKDAGAWSAEVTITGAAQTLSEGVTVTFAATTGHTLNNQWHVAATSGVAVTAKQLRTLSILAVGTGSELTIRDGATSAGTLFYDSVTANWVAGRLDYLGFNNTSGYFYVSLYSTGAYASLILGTS